MLKKPAPRLAKLKRRFLLLDLSRAKVPGYARIDMEHIPFAYFQLRAAEGGWQFGYTNQRGDFDALAFFTNEADGRAVLSRVGAAYLHPHPLVSFFVRMFVFSAAFSTAFFLVMITINAILVAVDKKTPPQPQLTTIAKPPVPEGVPFDADSKLTVPK